MDCENDDSDSTNFGDNQPPEDDTNPEDSESPLDDWIDFQRFRARRNSESHPAGSLMIFLSDQDATDFGGNAASMADLIIKNLHPSVKCSRSDALAWSSLFLWDFMKRTPTPFMTGEFGCLWLTRDRNGETVSCLESLFTVDGAPARPGTHEVRFLSKRKATQASPGSEGQAPMLMRTMDSISGGIGKLFPEEIAASEVNYPERIVGVKRKVRLSYARLFLGKVPPEGEESSSKELQRFLPLFLRAVAEQVAEYLPNPLILHVWRFVANRISRKQGTKASESEVLEWLQEQGVEIPDSETFREALDDCACFGLAPGKRCYNRRWPLLLEAVLRHREQEFGIPRVSEPSPRPKSWMNSGKGSISPESRRH